MYERSGVRYEYKIKTFNPNTNVTDSFFKIDETNSELNILDLILKVNFAPSRGEARRLIMQGGVSINSHKITDPNFKMKLSDGMILKVGKRKFIKFVK